MHTRLNIVYTYNTLFTLYAKLEIYYMVSSNYLYPAATSFFNAVNIYVCPHWSRRCRISIS